MADSEDKSTDVRHVQDQLASAFESTVLESVGMRDDVASTGEDATRASVASAVNQMVSMGISDKDRHPGHGHSSSQSEDTRHCVKNQPPVKPLKGQEGHGSRGDVQSEQGWRSVHDAVSYQPPEKVIDSVVKRCGAEWYRVGIRLGYNDSQVTAITHHIPTPEGKLEAIIQRKLMKESRGEVAEALLDVCDQLMPLTVVSVMEDLGIQYLGIVSDHLLYEVGREVAGDWKVVARCLGLTAQDMAYIRVKAKSARNRARTMLKLWYAKIRSNVSVQKIHEILQQLRTRKAKPRQNSQIFPANIHVNHRLCGRENELEGIARAFWGEASDKEAPTEIAKYCLQIVSGLGGIGKTAISEKYAVEWMKKYLDGVFHFNAESLSSLHISIKNNLRELSLESGGGGVLDDNKILLQCISDKDRVLLIYDGADDLDLLNSVLPGEMSHVHVLVTTRMSDDHPIRTRADKVTCLGRLGVCAGVEALQELSGHASEILHEEELMFARRLVDESPIEGLPLAIAHAATSIRLGKMKYEQYYELLKKRQAALQALALDMDKLLHYFKITSLNEELMQLGITKPGDLLRLTAEDIQALSVDTNKKRLLGMAVDFLANSNPVHLTWQLDIETVKDRDSNAMNLLSYASLLSPRNISERVLRPLLYSDDIFALQYRISLSTLRAHSLVDVRESNEGCRLDMHPLVHSTVLERVMREPEALQYRLNRLADSLLNLIPIGDNDIMRSMRDNDFLSLIPHVYAVAEKALWIQDDQKCNLLVATACRIASRFQHRDVFVRLCEQRLQYVSTNNIRRVEALFLMAKSCNLVANYQLAQTHLMEALQILESSSDCDEATLEHCYILGEFVLGGHI